MFFWIVKGKAIEQQKIASLYVEGQIYLLRIKIRIKISLEKNYWVKILKYNLKKICA